MFNSLKSVVVSNHFMQQSISILKIAKNTMYFIVKYEFTSWTFEMLWIWIGIFYIMQGGETWVLNPTDNSLAFMLADEGYEVWLGNSCTCKFAFGHIQYNSNGMRFVYIHTILVLKW